MAGLEEQSSDILMQTDIQTEDQESESVPREDLGYSERVQYDYAYDFSFESEALDSTNLLYHLGRSLTIEDLLDGFSEQSPFDNVIESITTQANSQTHEIFDPYNYIKGTNSNDYIITTIGMDYVMGLSGNDTIYFSLGNDIIYGQGGSDTYNFSTRSEDFSVNLGSSRASSSFGFDQLYSIENVVAGSGNDTIYGSSADNILTGGDGNDTLYGLNGNDTFIGGLGSDTIYGGNGRDTLDYSFATADITVSLLAGTSSGADTGNDTLSSIETLKLGSGNDIAIGDNNDNWIYGGDGNDNITGLDGDDTFYGGAGNDIFDGGDGTDTVDYSSITVAIDARLSTSTGSSAQTGTDTYSNIENIIGGSGDDTIHGNGGSNILYGGSGNDRLESHTGNDIIYGGDGDDYIDACGNSDILYGGAGADILIGGGSDDIFMFMFADGLGDIDNIRDFNIGQGDSIDISDLLFNYDSLQDDINDFVSLVVVGGDINLNVDIDGTGTAYASETIVLIDNGAALVLATLITDGDLII